MKNLSVLMLIATLFVVNIFVSKADTKQDIEKANKKGQIVFLVVTETGNYQNQEAMKLAKSAQKLYPKSAVLELDRGNFANTSLIQKYRLAGVPTPLVIVIATNGYVTGGAPLPNLTSDALVKMVPTPKEEVVIKSLNEGNPVFVVFSKKSDTKNKKQLDACQSACQSMGDKAKTINIDFDDKNEKSFIAKFNIANSATFPITYVINAQGQVTSMLSGITEAKSLVSAAQKRVSGCGTGSGCGTSCGPTKK
jgi:GTPase Era involved in 16S rRNA processing